MLKLFRYAWDVDPTEHFLKIARRLTDYPDKNSSPDIASMKRALIAAPVLMSLVFLYGVIGLYAAPLQFRWFRHARPASEAFRAGILIVEPRVVPLTRLTRAFDWYDPDSEAGVEQLEATS